MWSDHNTTRTVHGAGAGAGAGDGDVGVCTQHVCTYSMYIQICIYIRTYKHIHILYIHTYIHTYVHTYTHTLQTYVHVYIHCMDTYTCEYSYFTAH